MTVAERAAVEPPRLGKHRFEAAPLAVLTSDEVTGSLREIKVRKQGKRGWDNHKAGRTACGKMLCAAMTVWYLVSGCIQAVVVTREVVAGAVLTALLSVCRCPAVPAVLQPCFMLAADRYKALQKRGVIEPRKPSGRKQGKKIEYVAGERQERAREAQQEIENIKKARKKAAKSGSAAAAEAVVVMAGGKGSSKRKRQEQQKQPLAPGSILPLEVAVAGQEESW